MAKKTTILVDEELDALVQREATKAGLAWTTMLKVLAREAISARASK